MTATEGPPPTLWHYTSYETFIRIFESRTIHASEIRYVNDSSEFEFAMEIFDGVAKSLSLDERGQALVAEVRKTAIMRNTAERPTIFAFCLSTKRDDLAQWRGYCPNGGGVSLGFDTAKLQSHLVRHNIGLERCIYAKADQEAKVRDLLAECVAAMSAAQGSADELREAFWDAQQQVKFKFDALLPLLKHPAFEQEKEWRIVARARESKGTRFFPKTRPGITTLIPFVEISLAEDLKAEFTQNARVSPLLGGDWPITSILCGPTRHRETARSAAQGEANRHFAKENEFNVDVSNVPYRSNI